MATTITELTSGMMKETLSNQRKRWNRRLLSTTRMPMPIKTVASPRLNIAIREIPNGMRLMDSATSRMAMASGQGTRPPLIPSVSRERQLICIAPRPACAPEGMYPTLDGGVGCGPAPISLMGCWMSRRFFAARFTFDQQGALAVEFLLVAVVRQPAPETGDEQPDPQHQDHDA